MVGLNIPGRCTLESQTTTLVESAELCTDLSESAGQRYGSWQLAEQPKQ